MTLLIIGGLLIGAATVLDLIFRERMKDARHKTALVEGGGFNHTKYHRVRSEFGWAAWPVYLMWVFYAAGVILAIAGFFEQFGMHAGRHG
jgi:hypothetical protein